MKRTLENLLSVKSIVTLVMTVCMAAMLLSGVTPGKDVLALFCTSYGAIITYFFTKKDYDGRPDAGAGPVEDQGKVTGHDGG